MTTILKNNLNELEPWLITRAGFRSLMIPDEKLDVKFEDFFSMRQPMSISKGVAEIHIHKALTSSLPPIFSKLGLVTEYGAILDEIEEAKNEGAEAFLFVSNSPGGSVAGNIEVAEAIASIEQPTATYCEGLACSAAYKLAAGTDAIFASPSATVGNIGTVLAYVDDSKFWEANGVEFKAITNEGADLKGTFYESALSETQLQFLQESVNESGRQFRAHVEAHRNVDEEVFRAGWYSGETALKLGLIDGLGDKSEAIEFLKQSIVDGTQG